MRALLAAVGMVAVLFPATVPVVAQDAKYLELAVWYDGPRSELAPLEDLAWLFRQGHQAVVPQILQQPTLVAYAMLRRWTGVRPAGAPDLTVINDRWIAQFAGALKPLDETLTEPEAAKLLGPALELFRVNGQLRAVPWSVGARVLVVRKDLLQARKIPLPQTWDDVIKVAAALHEPAERWGLGLPGVNQGGGALLLQEMAWAEGDTTAPTGNINLCTQPYERALERYRALAHFAQPEVLSWTQRELEERFAAGGIGVLVTDTWAAKEWEGKRGMPEFVTLALPGQAERPAHLLGDGLALLSSSDEPALGLEFIRMLLTRRAQEKLMDWGGVPVHRELWPRARKDSLLGPVVTSLEQGSVYAGQPGPLLELGLEDALYLALSGRNTPAEALQLAQELVRSHAPTPSGAPPGVP